MKPQHSFQQYFAEYIGTFFLVFFGCGSIILAENSLIDSNAIPIVFGATVTIMIYSIGHVSGAHLNPAVTIAFFLTKKFSGKRLFYQTVFQFLGGISAGLMHLIIFGAEHSFGKTTLKTSLYSGVLVEFFLSFCLMFVIMSVATDSRAVGELAGLAIGLTVSVCAFVGGPLTGASMNPARSLGPAIFSKDYSELLLYIVVPVFGAFLGAKSYLWIQCDKKQSDSSSHGCC